MEAIIVDDGSTDNTVSLAKKHTPNVYPRNHQERSVQRNFGASKAKGKYLLFLDADMEMTSSVVADCVAMFESDPTIGAIAIPETPIATNFLEKVKAFERSFYSEAGDKDTDAARFFSKTVFQKVGGFDASLTGPEDWDLPERIAKKGYRVARVQSRINHYERIPSFWKLIKKKYYYALTSHRYLKSHNISVVGPKTIYFLRPVFYRNWKKIITHPILSISMIIVFTGEMAGGILGFIIGKIKQA